MSGILVLSQDILQRHMKCLSIYYDYYYNRNGVAVNYLLTAAVVATNALTSQHTECHL